MSSNIPIVQGVAVEDGSNKYQPAYGGAYAPNHQAPASMPSVHAEELEQLRTHPVKQYQDVVWALLFIAHVCVMVAVIAMGLSSGSSGFSQSSSYGSIIFLTCVTGLSAVGLSTAALSLMMQHAETLVQMALIFSVLTSLAIGVLGFMTGSFLMGGLGLLSFAVGCCYAKVVWPRIPFAATNLNTALSAVRSNMGLTVVSFGFTAIAFGWTLLWFLGVGDALAGSNGAVVFLLVRINYSGTVSLVLSIVSVLGTPLLTASLNHLLFVVPILLLDSPGAPKYHACGNRWCKSLRHLLIHLRSMLIQHLRLTLVAVHVLSSLLFSTIRWWERGGGSRRKPAVFGVRLFPTALLAPPRTLSDPFVSEAYS